MSQHDLCGYEVVLARVYSRPKCVTVKAPAPPPYEVEVEEEFLERNRDGSTSRRKCMTGVLVSADDYPRKEVRVRKVQTKRWTVKKGEDVGPTEAYKHVSIALWALCALLAIIGLSSARGLLVLAAIGALAVIPLRGHLRRTRRVLKTIEREMVELIETTATVFVDVDPEHAPHMVEREIPNPTRVTAVGSVALRLDALKFGNGVLLVDSWRLAEAPGAEMPVLADADAIRESMTRLDEAIARIPAVLSGERARVDNAPDPAFPEGVPVVGMELDILRGFEGLVEQLACRRLERFRPNIVQPGHPLVRLLKPVPGRSASEAGANADLQRLRKIIPAEARRDHERFLDGFIEAWNRNQLLITKLRYESLGERMSPHVLQLGYLSNYSSFNFYCPHCIRDLALSMLARDYSLLAEQETQPVMFSRNSRCVYDPETQAWRCRACDASVPGRELVPVHKVLDDVLYPAYDRLMEENKIKRLEMDNKTRDDVITYENKRSQEIDAIQMTYERDRGSAQSGIDMAKAELDGQRQAITAIRGIMDAYQIHQTSVIKSIDDRCRQIQGEIQDTVAARRAEADSQYAALIEEFRSGMTAVARMKREEDLIRDHIQIAILANTGIIASNTTDIRQTNREIASHTADIRQSNREIASHTADIRQTTRQIATDTSDIRRSNQQIASDTANIRQSNQEIATSAKDIRESNRRIASDTSDIRQSSRQTADQGGALLSKTDALHAEVVEGNALQAARAKAEGMDLYDAAWYRLDKNIPKFAAGVVSDVAGSTGKDRAKRVRQYLN